mmetsp:Transcript_1536/g.4513  ORF Transcript_1536/g.4513 Transcript_1536/m.4513 type:complete len:269 (-) Transcript_1536:11-817(-)
MARGAVQGCVRDVQREGCLLVRDPPEALFVERRRGDVQAGVLDVREKGRVLQGRQVHVAWRLPGRPVLQPGGGLPEHEMLLRSARRWGHDVLRERPVLRNVCEGLRPRQQGTQGLELYGAGQPNEDADALRMGWRGLRHRGHVLQPGIHLRGQGQVLHWLRAGVRGKGFQEGQGGAAPGLASQPEVRGWRAVRVRDAAGTEGERHGHVLVLFHGVLARLLRGAARGNRTRELCEHLCLRRSRLVSHLAVQVQHVGFDRHDAVQHRCLY